MMHLNGPHAALAALIAFVLAPAGALSQEVHKCTQGGEVTYQAKPCPGDDKVLPIPVGPDAGDVEAARQRAAAQKARARDAGAPAAASGSSAAASAPRRAASAGRPNARPDTGV